MALTEIAISGRVLGHGYNVLSHINDVPICSLSTGSIILSIRA